MKCTPAQLLVQYQSQLTEPDAIGVMRNREGGYVVCVKFDGVYHDHEDAMKAAETIRAKVRSAVHKAVNAQDQVDRAYAQVDRAQARMDEL
jgi:hypothetical protein